VLNTEQQPSSLDLQDPTLPLDVLQEAVSTVVDTFSIQLGLEVEPDGAPTTDCTASVAYSSDITLTGNIRSWVLTLICDDHAGKLFTRTFFEIPADEDPTMEDISDALAEIPNVAGGMFKAIRAEAGEKLRLGLPIFSKGSGSARLFPRGVKWIAQNIRGPEELTFQIGLIYQDGAEAEGNTEMATTNSLAVPKEATGTMTPEAVLQEAIDASIHTCEIQLGLQATKNGTIGIPDANTIALGSTIALTSDTGCWNYGWMCDAATAKSLTRILFALEETEEPTPEDIADALGELANVAGGTLRAKLVGAGAAVQLGLPLFMDSSSCLEFLAPGIQDCAQQLTLSNGQSIQIIIIYQGEQQPASAQQPEQVTTPAPTSLILPKARDVVDFAKLLIGRNPMLAPASTPLDLAAPPPATFITHLVNNEEQVTGAIVADLAAVLFLAGSLIMMPDHSLKEQFEGGEASEGVIDALDEIFNNLRGLLNKIEDNSHVKPLPCSPYVTPSAEHDHFWVLEPAGRLDLAGSFPFGPGHLLFLSR